MATKTENQARLAFRKSALEKLRTAYLALIDGEVKSFTIGDRTLTLFDIDRLSKEIDAAEKAVDELETVIAGGRRRKVFAVVPRDW